MTPPDCDDPELISFMRGPLTELLTRGQPGTALAQHVEKVLGNMVIGEIMVLEENSTRYWYLMLNLRGARSATIAWPPDGHMPGTTWRRVHPSMEADVAALGAVVSPVIPTKSASPRS